MSCPLTKGCPSAKEGACGEKKCVHTRLLRMALGEKIQSLVNKKEQSPEDIRLLGELKRDYARTLREEEHGNKFKTYACRDG